MAESILPPIACWSMTYFASFDNTTSSPFLKTNKQKPSSAIDLQNITSLLLDKEVVEK